MPKVSETALSSNLESTSADLSKIESKISDFRNFDGVMALSILSNFDNMHSDAFSVAEIERVACDYICDMSEGLLQLDGVKTLPKVAYLLMSLRAVTSDYRARGLAGTA